MVFTTRQLTLLSSYFIDVAKGLSIAYLAGSLFVGKTVIATTFSAVQTIATIAFLLYLGILLGRNQEP